MIREPMPGGFDSEPRTNKSDREAYPRATIPKPQTSKSRSESDARGHDSEPKGNRSDRESYGKGHDSSPGQPGTVRGAAVPSPKTQAALMQFLCPANIGNP